LRDKSGKKKTKEYGYMTMMVFLGETRASDFLKKIKKNKWGRIFVETRPQPFAGEIWAFDNGAWLDFVNNRPFDDVAFMRRLYRAYRVGYPLFGVVPDIVGGGMRSLDFSLYWRDRLPNDWAWYLPLQDGMKIHEVKNVANMFDGFFIGGTDKFKLEAAAWVDLARKKQKPIHYGRCGTLSKVGHAKRLGVDSIDSSFPLWTKSRFDEFVDCVTGETEQLSMFAA